LRGSGVWRIILVAAQACLQLPERDAFKGANFSPHIVSLDLLLLAPLALEPGRDPLMYPDRVGGPIAMPRIG
jgi:hypothetical protein